MLSLTCLLLEIFTNTHKDYLQLLKEKSEFIADILLYYSTQLTEEKVLNVSMYQKVEPFCGRDLAYLLALHASCLQTGTNKFRQDNKCPLVTDTVLDSTHYILRD